MSRYKISKEEMRYLKQYDIAKYERPSVAADMAIYSIMEEGEKDNFRKLAPKALKLLLIKRASYPFKGCWSLPGGFCRPDEDIYETAKRKLYEETNIKASYLKQAGVFGDIGRDPRGWIISNTFLSLVDGAACSLPGGSDAWEAKWFSIGTSQTELKKEIKDNVVEVETLYRLSLRHDETQLLFGATVKEFQQFKNYHETVHYEIMDCEDIAFDHAKLILHTLLFLRKSIKNDLKIGFDFMPEVFTLTELQNVYELVWDQKLLTANFRRKIGDYVVETKDSMEGEGHRPAKLFKRNVARFYDSL